MNNETAQYPFARSSLSWPLFLALLMCSAFAPAQAWWNKDWHYQKKIMLDASPSGVPLTGNLAQVPVLLRLHSGNFGFFFNMKPDGSDMRFIASDDKTPLKFHIEHFDNIAGLATIWVQVPALTPGSKDAYFWMYYGNESAPAAQEPAATYDVPTVAVYHFAERAGLPKDSSAYSNHPAESSAALGQPGIIYDAAGFNPSASMKVPSSPVLGISAEKGFTFMGWIRLTKSQEKGLILSQENERSGFRLESVNNSLSAQLTAVDGKTKAQVQGSVPLAVDRWYHVAVTIGAEVKLFIDGELVSTAANPGIEIPPADIVFGANAEGNGFTGLLDETQLSYVERPADWIVLAAKGQGPDGKLVGYGEDASQSDESSGGFTYLSLVLTLAKAVSVDGWVIIGITLVLGFIAFDVMVSRFVLLRRVAHSDDEFVAKSRELMGAIFNNNDISSWDPALEKMSQNFAHSVIFQVFRTGMNELEKLFEIAAARGTARRLTAEGIEVIRSGLDVAIVAEENRLNARMVLVTVAISGAPFLGLLGTVVGVMMTFATVAATGDVNVNTIAPGVASAMATTVVGLFVAIPCMFGYNYLATLISKRMSAMEVFADQLVSTFAVIHSGYNIAKEQTDATQNPPQTL